MYQHPGPFPPRPVRSGPSSGVVVLLWVFVGWPLSWLLLFVFFPIGILFGVGITVWMIILVSTAPSVVAGPPLPVVYGPPPPPSVWQQVEGLASITAIGGCGWCGSLSAHVNDAGYPVHPRFWHAAEIEERVRARTLGGG